MRLKIEYEECLSCCAVFPLLICFLSELQWWDFSSKCRECGLRCSVSFRNVCYRDLSNICLYFMYNIFSPSVLWSLKLGGPDLCCVNLWKISNRKASLVKTRKSCVYGELEFQWRSSFSSGLYTQTASPRQNSWLREIGLEMNIANCVDK